MLYNTEKIREAIDGIVDQVLQDGLSKVEIGIINWSSSGSVITDKSLGRGFGVFAQKPGENTFKPNVTVQFNQALSAYDYLRAELIAKEIEFVRGEYQFHFAIPEKC